MVDPTAHLHDWNYTSQFACDIDGIQIFVAGVLTDPDSNSVLVGMKDQNNNIIFANQTAVRKSVGVYQIQFTGAQTSVPGFYILTWNFHLSTVAETTETFVQVGAKNPAYDNLPAPMQDIVQSVWVRFADMFDSPQGGPHLQIFFQTNFSLGRIAQLLKIALGLLNTTGQPYSNYQLSDPGEFPYAQWGSILEEALYVECIKHLIRSYVEQPLPTGVTIARQDRRDFQQRWTDVLTMEQETLKSQLEVFRIAHMFTPIARSLVSGGVFGNMSPSRMPGNAAPRGRFSGYYR
jgi:hypothetical protein